MDPNEDTEVPVMDYIDIAHTRRYLRAAGISFNRNDEIQVDGDMGKLEGSLHAFGRGPKITFAILLRYNGVFVDWFDGYDRSYIKKVEDR